MDKAFEIIFNGKSSYVDAFLINNQFSCHVCGLGFDAQVAYEFSKQKKRGFSSYARIALKNFLVAKTYLFAVESDNTQFEVGGLLICIANSNQFGNNFKIAPQASLCDGLLDIVIVKKTNKFNVVFSFVRQILAGKTIRISEKEFHKKNILYFQTKKIRIENPQNAPLHIDGDPAESSKDFSIEILPSAYRLIQS